MLLVILLLASATVGLVAVGIVSAGAARPKAVEERLARLRGDGRTGDAGDRAGRGRGGRQRLEAVLTELGTRTGPRRKPASPSTRKRLMQAGYGSPNAVVIYRGARVALALALGAGGLIVGGAAATGPGGAALWTTWLGAAGWVLPALHVGRRRRSRRRELQRALPDTIDLLVVCVEAGLGLNQALVRVAREIRHVSSAMSGELGQTNAAIRAGARRADALSRMAERTGLDDVRALTTMLIQTDRFGTSVGDALRVHADTLRTKRRQRVEEAAAKTTIKMVFPLVLCIFPALFVVILGPAFIRLFEALGSLA